MATESNATGFHPSSFSLSRHAISFQSGASMSASSEMVPMMRSNYFGANSVGAAGMIFAAGAGASTAISHSTGLAQAGTATATGSSPVSGSGSGSGSLLLGSPGLKHDTGFAAEWSVDEQYKLEEGLNKFTDEPSIMKYIKIAASLHNKSVRDVALRCRWITRKRRKSQEHSPGKKPNNRKDKSVESAKVTSNLPVGVSVYSPFIHHMNQKDLAPFEGLCGNTRHLLEQNTQAFSQINTNLHTCKLQENVDLFCHARNNISAILSAMSDTPGIMSQMPPLPVSLNEDLANSVLPSGSHPLMFGSSSSGMHHMKQEPRC